MWMFANRSRMLFGLRSSPSLSIAISREEEIKYFWTGEAPPLSLNRGAMAFTDFA